MKDENKDNKQEKYVFYIVSTAKKNIETDEQYFSHIVSKITLKNWVFHFFNLITLKANWFSIHFLLIDFLNLLIKINMDLINMDIFLIWFYYKVG